MQKLILVKTPLTVDGNMPMFGADGKRVYSESILTDVARKPLEKRNASLPEAIRVIIEDYTPPAEVAETVAPEAVIKPKVQKANA